MSGPGENGGAVSITGITSLFQFLAEGEKKQGRAGAKWMHQPARDK
jgi:hypothetical protein